MIFKQNVDKLIITLLMLIKWVFKFAINKSNFNCLKIVYVYFKGQVVVFFSSFCLTNVQYKYISFFFLFRAKTCYYLDRRPTLELK